MLNYIAVMDCDDEIHSLFGSETNVKVKLDMTLLAKMSQFSYEE